MIDLKKGKLTFEDNSDGNDAALCPATLLIYSQMMFLGGTCIGGIYYVDQGDVLEWKATVEYHGNYEEIEICEHPATGVTDMKNVIEQARNKRKEIIDFLSSCIEYEENNKGSKVKTAKQEQGSIFLGIDPGASGGYAFLKLENSVISVVDAGPLPVWRFEGMTVLDVNPFHEIIDQHKPNLVILEKSMMMPGGGKAIFQTGGFLGSLFATFHTRGEPLICVTSSVWKRHFGLLITKEKKEGKTTSQVGTMRKEQSMNLAASRLGSAVRDEYFPLKKNEGIAEACLIALYGIEKRR